MKDAGKSHQTIVHVRRVAHFIFDTLWRDEAITENPVARVKVPSMATDNRERAVLTDGELARYLAWEHPDEQHRPAVLERQTMACVARMFGGLRTALLGEHGEDARFACRRSSTHSDLATAAAETPEPEC